MKNLILVCLFFFVSGITLAQSKKEMIVILNNRVDSLNQIVATELSEKQNLNIEISNLKSQIKELERNNENLSNDKNAIETKNNALNQELQENQGQIVELNKQLKTKQDSLVLVTSELLKYKPAPPKQEIVVKQDNTGPIKTVTIGTQVWMKENLNVSVFKNGVAIPEVQDKDAWYEAGKNDQPAWCYYDSDPKNGAKYGKLYNWSAVVDTNGLCPQGWHVPSDAEWDILVTYLGGKDVAGHKMKAESITKNIVEYVDVGGYDETETIGGWNGTNESGFTGLPGGNRYGDGSYGAIGDYGIWWGSTEYDTSSAWYRYLNYNDGGPYRNFDYKEDGLSVRCLRD